MKTEEEGLPQRTFWPNPFPPQLDCPWETKSEDSPFEAVSSCISPFSQHSESSTDASSQDSSEYEISPCFSAFEDENLSLMPSTFSSDALNGLTAEPLASQSNGSQMNPLYGCENCSLANAEDKPCVRDIEQKQEAELAFSVVVRDELEKKPYAERDFSSTEFSAQQSSLPEFITSPIAEDWCVVETSHCNASSEIFTGKPGYGRVAINVSAIPARAIFGSLLHPSIVQTSVNSWDLAVAYSVSTTPTMNRVLLGTIGDSPEGKKIEMTTDGWLIPERITDCKWLSQSSILVAYGMTLALLSKSSCSYLESKRPKSKAFEPTLSFAFSDEQIRKSIREIEIIPGDYDLLIPSESSRLSRLSIGESRFIVDGTHDFHLDGVGSARALPGLPDLASCTLDSGRLFGFDARMRWEPVSSLNIPSVEEDDILLAHDWLDDNICICGSFNSSGSFLTYVDYRKTGSILFRKPLETLPYDVRTRNGNCLISGEPTFTFIPRGSVDHFCPKTPPQEIDYSPNTLCAFLDDSCFLSSSSHVNLRLWGLVA